MVGLSSNEQAAGSRVYEMKATAAGLRHLILSMVLLVASLGFASAQDLTQILGPLGSNVSLGTVAPWSVVTERGRVVFSDLDDAGAIRFYSAPWQGNRAIGRSVGVRVQVAGMDTASAGLIYNVRNEFPRWAALVVAQDGTVVLYARQATGITEVKRVPIPGGPHAEGEFLQISEQGASTVLLANGVEIGRLNMASTGDALPDLPAGIIVIGPGRLTFRDFAFGQLVTPHRDNDDRVPGRAPPVAGNDDRVPAPRPAPPDGPRPTPAPAPTPTPVSQRWPVPRLDPLAGNMLGATMGILAHEFGHFMIGELKLPATGPEEDVADEFAAMVFVDNMRDMPEAASSMALAMAKFWWYTAEDRGDAHQPPWFDEHAPDRARFGHIMCMLYGSAPQMFEQVMEQTGVPERTRARCIDDERKRHAAWDSLLRSHRRRGVDPVMPGDLDPATPGKRVTVEYQPPKDTRYTPLLTFLQRTRMLETAADLVSKLYVLPRDTKIIVGQCDVVNCFYNAEDGSVTMCYEMMAFVLNTFSKHEGSNGPIGTSSPGASPPTPANPPAPTNQPAGSSMNLAQFLAGTWRLQNKADNGVIDDIQIEAMADGTYRARHDAALPGNPHLVVGVVGRWSTEPAAGDRQFQLTLTPVQWSPRQYCGADGNCHPLNLDATHLTVQVVDRNTLLSAEGRAVRVQ